MKSAPPLDEMEEEEVVDICSSVYLARARPTMISAKYRLKEERRKVLKISVAKLKRIDDPESSLRRSVLINNTVRRLQREARDEKMHRQQSVSPYLLRPKDSPIDITLSLQDLSDALVDEDQLPSRLSSLEDSPSSRDASSPSYIGFDSMESSFAAEPSQEFSSEIMVARSESSSGLFAVQESGVEEEEREACGALVNCLDELATEMCRTEGEARVSEEEEDEEVEDVHSVLSQFYMPPTPRMLTSIDDEEEEAAERQERQIASESAERKRQHECTDESLLMIEELSEEMVLSGKRQRLSDESRHSVRKQRRARSSSLGDIESENSQPTQFSCGHSSIFGELQSVVFHSLIASLES
ncbi:hypothetical protein J437_LFUL017820 [Ladona fulva]|uniref:SERTA domain-containing protein n=1 Tax=Ladona fulva TaxID=123851 RepID=A0A8K0P6L9_LADFU|nr:hypothetical protein J437_LFUL017820 [Ladona fulva]